MPHILRYGSNQRLELDIPDEKMVCADLSPARRPLQQPAEALSAAIRAPLAFPPLPQAIAPGDAVTIAVAPGLPMADTLVGRLIDDLLTEAPEIQKIIVLVAEPAGGGGNSARDSLIDRLRSACAAGGREAAEVAVHHPEVDEDFRYLAAARDGEPVRIHRELVDADVVIPIGPGWPEGVLNSLGAYEGLFPTFSDARTMQRYRTAAHVDSPEMRQQRRRETDEAAWLLGVQFAIQVIPGPGDSVLQILAGEGGAVHQRSQEILQSSWHYRAETRADLVIATIAGGPEEQTWENLARALFTAEQLMDDDGVVVLCTELCETPGPALKRLRELDEHDDRLLRDLQRCSSRDAATAALMVEARRRGRLLLLSHLPSDTVEDLGIGSIDDVASIDLLARRCHSVVLVEDAHRAVGKVREMV